MSKKGNAHSQDLLKYQKLYNWCRTLITSGVIKNKDKFPSENILQKKFGYSRQTVRTALNQLEEDGLIVRVKGSGTYVSYENKNEDKGKPRVGLILSYFSDYLFPRVYDGIESVMTEKGYEIDVAVTKNRLNDEAMYLEGLLSSNLSGLIIEGTRSSFPNPNIRLYNEIRKRNIPTLFIHNHYPNQKFDSVEMSDARAGYEAAKILIQNGHRRIGGIFKYDDMQGMERYKGFIECLSDYGVKFDRDSEGNLAYTREGAHSEFRILHHQDVTGKEITSKLIRQVKLRNNITVIEEATMLDIISENNKVSGIIMENNSDIVQINAKVVILATGGIGGLFKHSTNFRHITGDSFAIALRNNIQLENINYIQIHPTTLYTTKPGRSFLISESVRGEGAYLLNCKMERFVNELLPRDVVSNAIKNEMNKYNMPYVYLSVMHMDHQQIQTRFPHIYDRCLKEGYDMYKEPIPVVPAQHYLMGGIKSDTFGKTSMENLYAVGETACNGVHGANRLASNSLLESLVFAKRAARVIKDEIENIDFDPKYVDVSKYDKDRLMKENRDLIMNEIKRKDGEFYDKWCKS